MRITKRSIEALKKPDTGYAIYRDETRKGMAVRITSAGVISFVFEKRINGRTRRLTIGRYPNITPDQARKRVNELSVDVMKGNDPVTEHKMRRMMGVTLAVALDDYLREKKLKNSSKKDYSSRIKMELSDWLQLPIKRITREMVAARHSRIGNRSPSQANATMRYLRAILNRASIAYGTAGAPFLSDIPTRKLSDLDAWYKINARRTSLKIHELPAWWAAVEALATDPMFRHGPEYRDYFQWLILTGFRRNEALSLTWVNVDFKDRTVTLTDTKNSEPHTLPLTNHLLAILKRRQERSGGAYVFSGPDGQQNNNLRTALKTVIENGGVGFIPHDLRRTFATIANRLDLNHYTIKRLLNHKISDKDVTEGYVVIDVERLRQPMQKIGDFILRAAGVIESAPVVELKGSGAA